MRVKLIILLVGFGFLTMFYPMAVADVVLQTSNLRLEIDDDGMLKSLAAKPSGVEYGWIAESEPVAVVYRGMQQFPASEVSLHGNKLVVCFAKANATATYEVIRSEDYLALELLGLKGDPIDRIELLRLKMKKLAYRGPWINVNYDDSFGICLCAGNVETDAGMVQHEGHVVMRAIAEKEVGLEGTIAVLFGCSDPKNKFLDVMDIVERDFNMPRGAKNRRSPMQKYSYYWAIDLSPANVGEHISTAKRAGFRMILFSYTCFSGSPGHFNWNSLYPNGMADLKKITAAIRNAGLKLGLHIHYNKTRKNDPYVTPVPDDRLHVIRAFTLTTAVDSKSDTIAVNENPKGCALSDGMRILKAGKELIVYKGYTTEPPFQFTGCQRGHLNTIAAAHAKGSRVGLLNVDDWPVFIRFDQNTDIQDEVAGRIADIYHRTGPYDMVYFDGGEDVHAPFWYHLVNAQYRVYRQLQPKPIVCETALNSHFSWHMMSRSNAYDHIAPDKMKLFCRVVPYRAAPARARDFTRIEFGWLSRDHDQRNYIGLDTLEYILSSSAAWDCPISLMIPGSALADDPRAEDCFDVINIWEDARIKNKLSDAQLTMLRDLGEEYPPYISAWGSFLVWADMQKTSPLYLLKGIVEDPVAQLTDTQRKMFRNIQEHHLFINEKGEHELVAIKEIPDIPGGESLKAYSFQRATRPNDTYVLIWAVTGEADILLPVAADRLTVLQPFATRMAGGTDGDKVIVRVGNRKYLVFADMGVDQTVQLLHKTKLRPSKSSSKDTTKRLKNQHR